MMQVVPDLLSNEELIEARRLLSAAECGRW